MIIQKIFLNEASEAVTMFYQTCFLIIDRYSSLSIMTNNLNQDILATTAS